MKTVGERIRQAREYRRLSAEALAKEVGYSTQSGISNLENRAAGRGGFNLTKIASALDVSLEWLLNGPDVEDMAGVAPFFVNDPSVKVEEAAGQYLTTRQHAHQLVDQLSELGIEKAISLLEIIALAHPRSKEIRAGVFVPASVKANTGGR